MSLQDSMIQSAGDNTRPSSVFDFENFFITPRIRKRHTPITLRLKIVPHILFTTGKKEVAKVLAFI